jgi:flagellar hook-basal body complex protein FliE
LAPASSSTGGFGSALQNAINQVEQSHVDAESEFKHLIEGGGNDVHNVMIAMEKADLAFQLMMQVRNKIVSAYEEVSKMQF